MNVGIQGSQERVSDSLELELLVVEHSPFVLGPNLGPLEEYAILMADGPSLQFLLCRLSGSARTEEHHKASQRSVCVNNLLR